MEDKYFYKVLGFFPSENSLGQFGFSVRLDKDLALRALRKELPEAGHKNLQDMAGLMLTRAGLAKPDDKFVKPVYRFIEMPDKNLSCLIQSCQVPGDACTLSADWSQIKGLRESPEYMNYFDYNPHNVDSSKQAYALLSAWLIWANIIESNV